MSITIKDIARMAGVSISTVSRVMNNSKPVNEKLRKRIMDVMEETRFRPNAMARGLVRQESNLLGIIVPDIRNTVFDDLINGINEVSKIYGYDIMLSLTGGNLANELHYLNLFHEKRTDGIIFSSVALKDEHVEIIKRSNIPFILVGQVSKYESIPSIHLDNFTASYEAVKYLINRGHRKIAMIRGLLEDEAAGGQRFQGYAEAMRDAGLAMVPEWIVPTGFSVKDGMESMQRILASGSMPTAVFCASDRIAIGAMNHLLEEGYQIPGDISVFGFDGIDMASIVRPKLSTVEYSAAEIGMTATRHLLKLIKGEHPPTTHTNVPHQLVFRDSVASI